MSLFIVALVVTGVWIAPIVMLVQECRKKGNELDALHEEAQAAFRLYKADANAYAACKGLWATDQPRLIKYHKERESFFRIGYPEDRLG